MSDANYTTLPKGFALWTPQGSAFGAGFSRTKGNGEKGMGRQKGKFHKRYTLWVTEKEAEQLEEQASVSGLSVSECLRRRGFGGRPPTHIVAQTDMTTVRELRRIGGLLKHHFETLRQAGASREHLEQQEETLRILGRAIEKLGSGKP